MMVLHGREKHITPAHLPEFLKTGTLPAPDYTVLSGTSLEDAVGNFERKLVLDALRKTKGVQTKAAQLLGTTRRIINYRMRILNIRASEVEAE
jgi:transcriptional regulator with GAF, ATPase, and Fis domain